VKPILRGPVLLSSVRFTNVPVLLIGENGISEIKYWLVCLIDWELHPDKSAESKMELTPHGRVVSGPIFGQNCELAFIANIREMTTRNILIYFSKFF
jgi:hypothetical protein